MSETQEGYGAQSTPDMGESYPPQTGDLLGKYVARLARTVVELDAERKAKSEEPSAYQRSLEARIERLEALIKRLMERMDVLDNSVEDYIMFGCDPNSCQRLEPAEEPTVTTPTVTRERTHGRYGTRNLTKSKNVCATCGHGAGLHVCHKSANGFVNYWTCNAGPLGQPCLCREYKPVATEG